MKFTTLKNILINQLFILQILLGKLARDSICNTANIRPGWPFAYVWHTFERIPFRQVTGDNSHMT